MRAKEERAQVAVIGAGIVGACIALALRKRGYGVALIDRDAPGHGCSYGNSGAISPSSVAPLAMPGVLASVPRMLLDAASPLRLPLAYLPRARHGWSPSSPPPGPPPWRPRRSAWRRCTRTRSSAMSRSRTRSACRSSSCAAATCTCIRMLRRSTRTRRVGACGAPWLRGRATRPCRHRRSRAGHRAALPRRHVPRRSCDDRESAALRAGDRPRVRGARRRGASRRRARTRARRGRHDGSSSPTPAPQPLHACGRRHRRLVARAARSARRARAARDASAATTCSFAACRRSRVPWCWPTARSF